MTMRLSLLHTRSDSPGIRAALRQKPLALQEKHGVIRRIRRRYQLFETSFWRACGRRIRSRPRALSISARRVLPARRTA